MKKRIFYVSNDTTCYQDIYTERNASLSVHFDSEVELTEADLEAIYGGLASPIVTPQPIASPSAIPQTIASPSAIPQTGASQNPNALSQMQANLEQQFETGLLQRILGDQGFSKF